MPERFWVVGARGMLGRAFAELLAERGVAHVALGRADLDLLDPAALRALPLDASSVVVNCAAFTDVDAAETHVADAMALNAEAVARLAERCAEAGALLVHFSTDYVFDGRGQRPYPTDHPIQPLNAYGRSKAEGERLLRQSGAAHLIARTSWLYAPWGRNFVLTIAKLCAERDRLRVVDDQRGRPSSAPYLAERTLSLVAAGGRGTFHVTDGGECTWYELACAVQAGVRGLAAEAGVRGLAAEAGVRGLAAGAGASDARRAIEPSAIKPCTIEPCTIEPCTIEPCTTEEFPRPAARPRYSVLDLSHTEALIGASRSWRENLVDTLRQARALGTLAVP